MRIKVCVYRDATSPQGARLKLFLIAHVMMLLFVTGHVFKSLNTSGLVPRQGKLIADRIDGIW